MQQSSEPHAVVRGRLIQASSSVYLTMLSVIQGVSLAYLATIVATATNTRPGFTAVQGLMTGLTVFLFILIWDSVILDTLVLTLIPKMDDVFLPFAAGVVELFACQAITLVPMTCSPWCVQRQ